MSPEMSSTMAGPLQVSKFGNTFDCVLPDPGGAIVTIEPSPEYCSAPPPWNDPICNENGLDSAKTVPASWVGLSQPPPPLGATRPIRSSIIARYPERKFGIRLMLVRFCWIRLIV